MKPAPERKPAGESILPKKASEDDPRRWGDEPGYDHDAWLKEQRPRTGAEPSICSWLSGRGSGLPVVRGIDEDKEQFPSRGSSGEDFGLLRIGGDNHKAVRLIRAQPLGGLASLPGCPQDRDRRCQEFGFLAGPSGPSAAVSTTSTTWPGEMSWIEAGSAMRSGTAAVAGAVPVSRPVPGVGRPWGSAPFAGARQAASRRIRFWGERPAGTPSGRTSRV